MKIICKNCNHSYTKLQAYIREKTYTENGAVWIQTVCKNCHYINNECEEPIYYAKVNVNDTAKIMQEKKIALNEEYLKEQEEINRENAKIINSWENYKNNDEYQKDNKLYYKLIAKKLSLEKQIKFLAEKLGRPKETTE